MWHRHQFAFAVAMAARLSKRHPDHLIAVARDDDKGSQCAQLGRDPRDALLAWCLAARGVRP
jgi:hypothetical protein